LQAILDPVHPTSWRLLVTKATESNIMANISRKSNIVSIAKTVPAKLPRTKKSTQKKVQSTQNVAAARILAVGLVLVGLSLSHLAQGIELVTGSGPIGSWSMAIGIDLGFIALELAMLTAPIDLRAKLNIYAGPAIIGTLAASALMNAFAFASHATGQMVYPAIALGCAIPALIFALTKTAATLAFHQK